MAQFLGIFLKKTTSWNQPLGPPCWSQGARQRMWRPRAVGENTGSFYKTCYSTCYSIFWMWLHAVRHVTMSHEIFGLVSTYISDFNSFRSLLGRWKDMFRACVWLSFRLSTLSVGLTCLHGRILSFERRNVVPTSHPESQQWGPQTTQRTDDTGPRFRHVFCILFFSPDQVGLRDFRKASSSTFSSVLLHLLPRHYPTSVNNVFSATSSASII